MFADRDFIRRQVHYWCNRHPAAAIITMCSIYAPCRVLTDIELWDTPGMNDSDPVNVLLMKEALAQAQVLIVLLGRALKAEMATREQLDNSQVLPRMLLSSHDIGYATFLHCTEKSMRPTLKSLALQLSKNVDGTRRDLANAFHSLATTPVHTTNGSPSSVRSPVSTSTCSTDINSSLPHSIDSSDSDSDEDDKDGTQHSTAEQVVDNMTQLTRDSLCTLLQEDSSVHSGRRLSRAHLLDLMEQRTTIRSVFPVHFASLALQQAAMQDGSIDGGRMLLPLAALSTDVRDSVMRFSAGHELLGLFRSLVPTLCKQPLIRFANVDASRQLTFNVGAVRPQPSQSTGSSALTSHKRQADNNNGVADSLSDSDSNVDDSNSDSDDGSGNGIGDNSDSIHKANNGSSAVERTGQLSDSSASPALERLSAPTASEADVDISPPAVRTAAQDDLRRVERVCQRANVSLRLSSGSELYDVIRNVAEVAEQHAGQQNDDRQRVYVLMRKHLSASSSTGQSGASPRGKRCCGTRRSVKQSR